ncbi:hypothetical protein DCC39_14895 [Pueribacillus theae]|uniref:Uncharacterized protein n=1 Tax=Pueribacillus theae TaxID=2171751 RepID=A0A2U1JUA6_9BACI|nr:hypothetical protein DCC39_14895 [Pueribacillus theae]
MGKRRVDSSYHWGPSCERRKACGKVIHNHAGGHRYPDDPSQNRGSHMNDIHGNHYDDPRKNKKANEDEK